MKQLIPTSIDEYIAEHKPGDTVSGRVIEHSPTQITVELGEGIRAGCRMAAKAAPQAEAKTEGKADLSSLSSMLQAKWKGGGASKPESGQPGEIRAGQVRSFRITKLDPASKTIEVELA